MTAPGLRRPLPKVWAAYGFLAVLLLAYLVSLMIRSPGQRSGLIDGWGVDAFEVVVSALAIARGLMNAKRKAVPLALGGAMLMWAAGDLALTVESQGGATPPSPSTADVFYLLFFPLAYLALVLMVRRESSRMMPAIWLDGVVAGLGAAALCAAFAFHSILHLTDVQATAAATNLAYPVGDVLLLAMVVGGSVLLSGSGHRAWRLVALGCAVNAAGDTFNLFNASGPSQVGAVVDGIAWPAALLLMSMAVWLRASRPDALAHQRAPGVLLPALGAAAALSVLLLGSVDGADRVAVSLAAATLLAAGVRLLLSVASLRRLTEERHEQAVTDHLTGLGNRRRLAAALDRFFAADPASDGETHGLAFLFVDLDRFKEVNDSFGHSAGDQLLTQIGPRIERCLEPSDLLVRIGGDEFAVVLFGAGVERAARVAEGISATVREPFVLDMVTVEIGTSIGIALAPSHAPEGDGLVRCADQAMYRAKQAGTTYEIYDANIDTGTDRFQLVEELRAAIDERRLELHYQPQVDLRSGAVPAVEALLRWPHPRLGSIPPLEFLPLAEEAGLMRPLTALVLDKALEQCAQWRAAGRPLSVSINVSATNVLDADFATMVRDHLGKHRVPPEALVLEITETTVISDFDRCKHVIDQLRELGCVISIDDFGAGFTSLAHLGKLAIGELKLDRTFLSALAVEGNPTLISAMIELAHALGLQVVAEGVEEQSTLDVLTRLGCDLAQGYHLGRPGSADTLALSTAAATRHAANARALRRLDPAEATG
jgi:diguanylate cyclase (GGDEF)-like protein